ncbi:MAG TPA: flagellar basal body rod C-terminal domain-containing protein [Phenylobacterium sp.]|uniref:flagellar basal body rod C-terminal domain-containing protein n=1 Tax=Phenylobacterium sp. TaxID=1871053 RepID=UPI002CC46963|nr:flagellar basal body rod C-terminal domain-containing protein [Phenylobacterium sp.]HSV01873.1 flagellar basal body rod C-terminal domain-containing protein [Phenylobacterium sp.]
MDPITVARYGMFAAEQRFAASAARTARMGEDASVDPAQEMVEQIQAREQFTASLDVVKVADEMWRSLLEVQKGS